MPADLFHIPLAFAATALLGPQPRAAAELPSGGGAFRERMMDWSASPAVTAPAATRAPAPNHRLTVRLPRLSSGFGYRSDPLRGTARMHSGIDIPGSLGTPILASAGGIVRFAGRAGGYGKMIEIAHGEGLTTRYAHLSRILVETGMPVARGETIALMGSTGRSTGSHLHFEVRALGKAANPLAYFGAAPLSTSRPVQRGSPEPHVSQFARARAAGASPPRNPF